MIVENLEEIAMLTKEEKEQIKVLSTKILFNNLIIIDSKTEALEYDGDDDVKNFFQALTNLRKVKDPGKKDSVYFSKLLTKDFIDSEYLTMLNALILKLKKTKDTDLKENYRKHLHTLNALKKALQDKVKSTFSANTSATDTLPSIELARVGEFDTLTQFATNQKFDYKEAPAADSENDTKEEIETPLEQLAQDNPNLFGVKNRNVDFNKANYGIYKQSVERMNPANYMALIENYLEKISTQTELNKPLLQSLGVKNTILKSEGYPKFVLDKPSSVKLHLGLTGDIYYHIVSQCKEIQLPNTEDSKQDKPYFILDVIIEARQNKDTIKHFRVIPIHPAAKKLFSSKGLKKQSPILSDLNLAKEEVKLPKIALKHNEEVASKESNNTIQEIPVKKRNHDEVIYWNTEKSWEQNLKDNLAEYLHGSISEHRGISRRRKYLAKRLENYLDAYLEKKPPEISDEDFEKKQMKFLDYIEKAMALILKEIPKKSRLSGGNQNYLHVLVDKANQKRLASQRTAKQNLDAKNTELADKVKELAGKDTELADKVKELSKEKKEAEEKAEKIKELNAKAAEDLEKQEGLVVEKEKSLQSTKDLNEELTKAKDKEIAALKAEKVILNDTIKDQKQRWESNSKTLEEHQNEQLLKESTVPKKDFDELQKKHDNLETSYFEQIKVNTTEEGIDEKLAGQSKKMLDMKETNKADIEFITKENNTMLQQLGEEIKGNEDVIQSHKEQIEAQSRKNSEEIGKLTEEKDKAMQLLKAEKDEKIKSLDKEHQEQIEKLTHEKDEKIKLLEGKIASLSNKLGQKPWFWQKEKPNKTEEEKKEQSSLLPGKGNK